MRTSCPKAMMSLAAVLLFVFSLVPPAFPVESEESESTDSEFSKLADTVHQEFDQFMAEYREKTQDLEEVREERKTLQEQMDEFLANLDDKSKNAQAAREEWETWLEERRQEMEERQNSWLEEKVFQTKVFFGGWSGFFLLLAVLFVLKLIFNITTDSLYVVRDWILGLFGIRLSRVGEHYLSPISTAGRGPRSGFTRTTQETPPRSPSTQKKLLFCEVWVQFVNPFADRKGIDRALEDQKAMPKPRPRIGEILKERGLMMDQEILDTLTKQRQYRSQR